MKRTLNSLCEIYGFKFTIRIRFLGLAKKGTGGLAGYLWRTICAHNTDEKCTNVIIGKKRTKNKILRRRKMFFDR